MIQEPTSLPLACSRGDDSELTEPRIPTQRRQTCPAPGILQVRQNGAGAISIDEQGAVTVALSGQSVLTLGPEEAFDLLDFLFEHRSLLAERSAQQAKL